MSKSNKKKALLKKIIHDGMGGRGPRIKLLPGDNAALSPLKNDYYKRVVAAGSASRIQRLTGLGAGLQGKYPKSRQEALDQLSGN